MDLKGPNHKKFVARIFTQIRPVWIGELETGPKTSKNIWLGHYIFCDVGEERLKFFFVSLRWKKSCFRLLLYTLQ
jgi:hypothetical protein